MNDSGINSCWQCGKCSAGCPAAFAMDYTPRQIVRMIQLGLEREAQEADAIWLCVACNTCSTRCPQGVDIPGIMEKLRREALALGQANREGVFDIAFINNISRFGRLHEMSFIMEYSVRSGNLLNNIQQGPRMLRKGKLRLWPDLSPGRNEVRRIVKQAKAQGGVWD